ncbi:MAG TPA: lipopolysaccharide biosynthesis protein [Candidatus Acidoferrales bacterium]|nr:lipopolysaccharide biosynthesis protein [Candidatus Acidoferrales bacterium]
MKEELSTPTERISSIVAPATTSRELFSGISPDMRRSIVSGMRWTLWLSILSVPLGYATTLILARVGPAAIGTYGVLMVYIAVVACLMYLGGDAVAIKFIPELPSEQQLPFVTGYALIVLACLLPWFAIATAWPKMLHFLFGKSDEGSLQILLIYLSPLYVIYSITAATLNGMLEIKYAQILKRVVTIGSFLAYAAFFFLAHGYLQNHYVSLVWEIYFTVITVAAAAGISRIVRAHPLRSIRSFLGFHLPKRFWSYTVSLQAVSAVAMLSNRLDYILILNFGGLLTLGKYVALRTISNGIGLITTFFIDTFLPTMANLVAQKEFSAASEAIHFYLRVLFAISFAVSCGLFVATDLLIRMFGPAYRDMGPTLVCMVFFAALQNFTPIAGNLLTATGKQHFGLISQTIQIGGFCFLFWFLWPTMGLMGTVIALGLMQVLQQVLTFYFVKRVVPIRFAIRKQYIVYSVLITACAAVTYFWPNLGLTRGILLYIGLLAAFYFLSRYNVDECKRLMQCFAPYSK